MVTAQGRGCDMSDPRKGLPLDRTASSFNEIAVKACMEDIQAALQKWNGSLIFQQVHRNGMPAEPGQYLVVRNPDEQKQESVSKLVKVDG